MTSLSGAHETISPVNAPLGSPVLSSPRWEQRLVVIEGEQPLLEPPIVINGQILDKNELAPIPLPPDIPEAPSLKPVNIPTLSTITSSTAAPKRTEPIIVNSPNGPITIHPVGARFAPEVRAPPPRTSPRPALSGKELPSPFLPVRSPHTPSLALKESGVPPSPVPLRNEAPPSPVPLRNEAPPSLALKESGVPSPFLPIRSPHTPAPTMVPSPNTRRAPLTKINSPIPAPTTLKTPLKALPVVFSPGERRPLERKELSALSPKSPFIAAPPPLLLKAPIPRSPGKAFPVTEGSLPSVTVPLYGFSERGAPLSVLDTPVKVNAPIIEPLTLPKMATPRLREAPEATAVDYEARFMEYERRIRIIKTKNPTTCKELTMPIRGENLDVLERRYKDALRFVRADNFNYRWQGWLIIGFLIIEAASIKMGLPAGGLAASQWLILSDYEEMLIELGEKRGAGFMSDWPVELRLVGTAVFFYLFFIILKWVLSWIPDENFRKDLNDGMWQLMRGNPREEKREGGDLAKNPLGKIAARVSSVTENPMVAGLLRTIFGVQTTEAAAAPPRPPFMSD